MERRMIVLQFDNVSYGYPGFKPVIADFSASLSSGEIVCLIGSSGCGKTTLLNLAGGFLNPGQGRVLDKNNIAVSSSPERVMVFQDGAQLFPWLTAVGNVMFPMKPLYCEDRAVCKKRADELLKLVGLPQAASLYPAQMSGGMKQRAVIARALASAPEILLLDEPFTALDAPTRRGLQNTLLELNAELKVSMLFVTHDIREAVYLADRLLIMGQDAVKEMPVGLERGTGARNEFSDEFVAIEREVYNLIKAV